MLLENRDIGECLQLLNYDFADEMIGSRIKSWNGNPAHQNAGPPSNSTRSRLRFSWPHSGLPNISRGHSSTRAPDLNDLGEENRHEQTQREFETNSPETTTPKGRPPRELLPPPRSSIQLPSPTRPSDLDSLPSQVNRKRTPNQTTQSIPSPHSPFRTESPRTTRPGSFMTPTAQRNRDQRMEELSLSDDEDNSATHRTSATKTAHYHSSEKERETRRARSEASRNPLKNQGEPFQHGGRLAAMMKHREREPVQNEVNKDNPALHRNHETPGDENKFDAPTPSQNAGDTEYDPFQQPSFDGNPSAPMNVTRNSPSVSIERPQRMDQLSALNRGEPLKVPETIVISSARPKANLLVLQTRAAHPESHRRETLLHRIFSHHRTKIPALQRKATNSNRRKLLPQKKKRTTHLLHQGRNPALKYKVLNRPEEVPHLQLSSSLSTRTEEMGQAQDFSQLPSIPKATGYSPLRECLTCQASYCRMRTTMKIYLLLQLEIPSR